MLVFALAFLPLRAFGADLHAAPLGRAVSQKTRLALAPLLPRVRFRFALRHTATLALGLGAPAAGPDATTTRGSLVIELIWTLPGGGAWPPPRTLDTTWRTVR